LRLPIDTSCYECDWECSEKCEELYQEVRKGVGDLLPKLDQLQSDDPNRFVLSRIVRKFLSVVFLVKNYDFAVQRAEKLM